MSLGSPSVELRHRQLNSISQFQPLQIDENTYEIKLHLPTMQLSLFVNLPLNFPNTKPLVYTLPKTLQDIRNERLDNWTAHSSLGKLVEQIILDFTLQPPQVVIQEVVESNKKYSYPARKPVVLSIFQSTGVLESKSDQEIKELLQDEDAFQDFFDGLDQVKPVKELYTDLLLRNAALARDNIGIDAEIGHLKSQISNLLSSTLQQRLLIDGLVAEQQREMARFSVDRMIQNCAELVSNAEDISDTTANFYLQGKITESEFVEQYRKVRRLYHLRNIKLERGLRNSK